ncbi:MAG TPA: rhomboid family intramembrane serine protease, partial [Armatimonadota bacterium]|nr:rhomboid family intramembrane serine protease [Armatimonadota bacterium]
LLGGVAAGTLHIVLNPHSTDPCVGASGAIAAVLGAYLVLYPRARIITLVPIYFIPSIVRPPAVVVLGCWFVVQLFSGMGSLAASAAKAGDVAYWAHVGGFLFGMAALPLFRERKQFEIETRGT